MATKTRFKGNISEAIQTSAAMLHRVGALDKATMRDSIRAKRPSGMALKLLTVVRKHGLQVLA